MQRLAEPDNARFIRRALIVVAGLWLILSLVNIFWVLVPAPQNDVTAMPIINAGAASGSGQRLAPVKLETMTGWNLFGTEDSKVVAAEQAALLAEQAAAEESDSEGIEKGAKETNLKLRLQGLVFSDSKEHGRAMIEHQGEQAQYAVDDKLPLSRRVTVAKIMSDRVVLNNSGKYELLVLFDGQDVGVAAMASAPAVEKKPKKVVRGDKQLTEMAESYRDRLYSNPQSLAEVVKISAMRVDGRLQGYRVSPGKDKDQFTALGFESNDIVTAVNGIELDDPGKAMELYRVMRSATEASFSVRRGEEDLILSVGLDGQGGQ